MRKRSSRYYMPWELRCPVAFILVLVISSCLLGTLQCEKSLYGNCYMCLRTGLLSFILAKTNLSFELDKWVQFLKQWESTLKPLRLIWGWFFFFNYRTVFSWDNDIPSIGGSCCLPGQLFPWPPAKCICMHVLSAPWSCITALLLMPFARFFKGP